MTLLMKHPFSAIIAGPSHCGKTYFVKRLIDNVALIDPIPNKIFYCYSEWQPLFSSFKGVQFIRDIDELQRLLDMRQKGSSDMSRLLVIFDDLMHESSNFIEKCFTKYSHHNNMSVIFITQNIFQKNMRTMSLNASYIFIFKNPRDIKQISYLSRQMYPSSQSGFLEEAYKDATTQPHGYLMLDLKQNTEDFLRVRSNIFPLETTVIYTPRDYRHILKDIPTYDEEQTQKTF